MVLFCSATLLPAGAATDKNAVGADQSAPTAADGSVEAEGEYKRTIEPPAPEVVLWSAPPAVATPPAAPP